MALLSLKACSDSLNSPKAFVSHAIHLERGIPNRRFCGLLSIASLSARLAPVCIFDFVAFDGKFYAVSGGEATKELSLHVGLRVGNE